MNKSTDLQKLQNDSFPLEPRVVVRPPCLWLYYYGSNLFDISLNSGRKFRKFSVQMPTMNSPLTIIFHPFTNLACRLRPTRDTLNQS